MMANSIRRAGLFTIPFILLVAVRAGADTVVLLATDSGFVNAAGRTSKYDGSIVIDATYNYSVGAIDDPPLGLTDVPRKNFFTFDLSGITEEILSAELFMYNPGVAINGVDGYDSPDPTETYVLGGTFTDPTGMSALAADLGMFWDLLDPIDKMKTEELYADLASSLDMGPPLGVAEVSAADNATEVLVPLTPIGIDYLNVFAGGPVVLSGLLSTLDGTDGPDEVMFGFTKPLISDKFEPTPTPVLVLTTIPEPSSIALGLAVACLFTIRRE